MAESETTVRQPFKALDSATAAKELAAASGLGLDAAILTVAALEKSEIFLFQYQPRAVRRAKEASDV